MAKLKLFRATPKNNLFRRLLRSWEKQVPDEAKDSLERQLDYHDGVADEDPTDPNYGVFVLAAIDADGAPKAPFDAFVHINHAFAKSKKPVLRLVWGRLAPKFSFDGAISDRDRAAAMSGVINGALRLSQDEMKSTMVKIYLGGAVDRDFATVFCESVNPLLSDRLNASVRGQWLHLNWR